MRREGAGIRVQKHQGDIDGMAGLRVRTYPVVRIACLTILYGVKIAQSSRSTTRERNFQNGNLDCISANLAATWSMVGRFEGSSWTISFMRGDMKSKP